MPAKQNDAAVRAVLAVVAPILCVCFFVFRTDFEAFLGAGYVAWSAQPVRRGDVALLLFCAWLLFAVFSPDSPKKADPETQKPEPIDGPVRAGRFD